MPDLVFFFVFFWYLGLVTMLVSSSYNLIILLLNLGKEML